MLRRLVSIHHGLTRPTLRWVPLSTAGGKEGAGGVSRLAALLYIEPLTSPNDPMYAIWHAGAVRCRERGGRAG